MAKFLKTLFFLLIGGTLLNVSSLFSQARMGNDEKFTAHGPQPSLRRMTLWTP
jgi:hypothetical protein